MSNIEKFDEAEPLIVDKKKFFIYLAGIIALLIYLHSILYGDYSISIYLDDKEKLKNLQKEYNSLQESNQKLQKEHFEMIQLTPDIDAF